MSFSKIGVLGAGGQMGQCLRQQIDRTSTKHQWDFFNSSDLDITQPHQIDRLFEKNQNYRYLINFAAFTGVDQAERQRKKARKVNAEALIYLSKQCSRAQVKLIHLSTDYVFDGKSTRAYSESDLPNPLNVYGKTKWEGEKIIRENLESYFLLRTGWIYSEFGQNFYRQMIKLASEKKEIRVVADQIGTPTPAKVVVDALLNIVESDSANYGLYHIGSEGQASWFDFAKVILESINYRGKLLPVTSSEFNSLAQRPKFSVLDKAKFKTTFNHKFPDWQDYFIKNTSAN